MFVYLGICSTSVNEPCHKKNVITISNSEPRDRTPV